MIAKLISFAIFFSYHYSASANQECANGMQFANPFSQPHCPVTQDINSFRNFFKKNTNQREICKECESKLPLSNFKDTLFQQKFTEAAFNEYRKSMSMIIMDLVALRSNKALNLNSKSVGEACNLNNFINKKKEEGKQSNAVCINKLNKLLGPGIGGKSRDIINELQTDFSNELARSLSNSKTQYSKVINSSTGLLTRTSNPNCPFSDSDVLVARSRLIENSFTKDFISNLKKHFSNIDMTSNNSSTELMSSALKLAQKDSKLKLPKDTFLNHPMLANLFKNPKSFKDFIDTLDPADSKETISNKINSPANKEFFEKNLIQKCNTNFEALEDTVCTNDFLDGNFVTDNAESLHMVNNFEMPVADITPDHTFAIENYCQGLRIRNSKTILFSEVNSKINLNNNLSKSLNTAAFPVFRDSVHNELIGTDLGELCDLKEKNVKCTSDSFMCDLFSTIDNLSPDRLKDSVSNLPYDESINEILSSIIGSVDNMTTVTKNVLIQHGVLKNDSKLAVPTPQPLSFQKIAANKLTNDTSKQPTPVTASQPVSQSPISNNADVNAVNKNAASAVSQTTPNQKTPTSNNNQTPTTKSAIDDDNRINEEILRRISNLPKKPNGETKKLTDQDIQDLVKKAMEQNQPSPVTQSELAQEMNKFYKNIPSYINNLQSRAPVDQKPVAPVSGNQAVQNRPGSLPGKTIESKNRSSASETTAITNSNSNSVITTAQKTVIKVKTDVEAIVITLKDEKIKESSEIKNLIANKTDFVLEVNGISFTINFPNPNDINSEILTIATISRDKDAPGIKQKLETYFHSQEVTNQIRLTNLNNILGTLKF